MIGRPTKAAGDQGIFGLGHDVPPVGTVIVCIIERTSTSTTTTTTRHRRLDQSVVHRLSDIVGRIAQGSNVGHVNGTFHDCRITVIVDGLVAHQ